METKFLVFVEVCFLLDISLTNLNFQPKEKRNEMKSYIKFIEHCHPWWHQKWHNLPGNHYIIFLGISFLSHVNLYNLGQSKGPLISITIYILLKEKRKISIKNPFSLNLSLLLM